MIIGQGIAGTCLAWRALQHNLSIEIYDQGAKTSASSVSSGIINPVTGPKYVKSWMMDDLLPAAESLYTAIEQDINEVIVHRRRIWRHLKDIKAENVWDSRMVDPSYEHFILRPDDHRAHLDLFNGAHRFGIVTGGLHLDVKKMISTLNQRWHREGFLINEIFDESQLEHVEKGYRYNGTIYKHVIMAQGHHGIGSRLFASDTYRPVKGEVLIVSISGLELDDIIKFGKFIMPLGDDIYWIGSNYQHDYDHDQPDPRQTKDLYAFLDDVLGLPYDIMDHQAGIRPATKYRRPLIGEHYQHKGLYLFNGLGTKGISLSPYFSGMLIESIKNKTKLDATKAYKDSFHI